MSIHMPSAENDYYWNLNLHDGRSIPIPPAGVPVVRRKIAAKDPVALRTEDIPFAMIKNFEQSSRRHTDVKLLEDTARAFGEPVVTEDGEVKARWVKKHVSKSEYDKYYAKSIMYRKLNDTEGMVSVATLLPVHKIDFSVHEYVTDEEEKKLH